MAAAHEVESLRIKLSDAETTHEAAIAAATSNAAAEQSGGPVDALLSEHHQATLEATTAIAGEARELHSSLQSAGARYKWLSGREAAAAEIAQRADQLSSRRLGPKTGQQDAASHPSNIQKFPKTVVV